MTIDDMIKQLETFKEHGVSGDVEICTDDISTRLFCSDRRSPMTDTKGSEHAEKAARELIELTGRHFGEISQVETIIQSAIDAACAEDTKELQKQLQIAKEESYQLRKEWAGRDGECFICKEPTSSLHDNPQLWSLWLPYHGGNGKWRRYHLGCVIRCVADAAACAERDERLREMRRILQTWLVEAVKTEARAVLAKKGK
jgi:hypothetical protein